MSYNDFSLKHRIVAILLNETDLMVDDAERVADIIIKECVVK